MKVIISGGSGLIGSALSRELASDRYQVIVLSRNPDKIHVPAGVKTIQWDGMTGQGWQGMVDRETILVNLAGENLSAGLWTEKQKERIRTSRLLAGEATCAAIQAAAEKPALLVQASAVGFYGSKNPELLDETSPAGDDFLARLAVDWEASTQPVEQMGVRRVVIRTGLVMHPTDAFLKNMLLTTRAFLGGKLGSGKQMWSWIHIQDEAAAIRFLIENDQANGVYNLTSPNPVNMDTFGRMLSKTLHKPYWLPVPAFALKTLLGEMSQLILSGQHVQPTRLLEAGYQHQFADLQKAFNDLL